jgi:signal transduction histidine kinase
MFTSTAQEKTEEWESTLDDAVGTAWLEAASYLMDGLLHEARNPLNALAIHLEVLSEKVRSGPAALGSAEKNLRTMRDQVYRVDQILRRFADFIAPRSPGQTETKLSELLQSALDVLGHQIRKRNLRLSAHIEPDVFIAVGEGCDACFLALQPILRSVVRSPVHSDLRVSLTREGNNALLAVDAEGWRPDKEDRPLAATLARLCQLNGGSFSFQEGKARLALPLLGTA